jgi:hypothetical protein
MDYLGLKDSSRQLQANCAISYSFYLHLMLHACAARFDSCWVESKQGLKEKLYTVADRKTFLLPPCLADKAKIFLLPLYPLCKIPVA